MKNILFVNNIVKNCGCYQVGMKSMRALKESKEYNFIYREISSAPELDALIALYNPDSILFNFHPIIMPWVNKELLDDIRKYRPVAFVHEYLAHAPREYFRYYFYSDTGAVEDYKDKPYVFVVGRLLNEYHGEYPVNKLPTFGSYGFALPIKRLDYVVVLVTREYEEAVINLHIPNAHYGDEDSTQVKVISEDCRRLNVKPGIQLNITTDFRNEEDSLKFLAGNDMNIFMYADAIGHGVASSVDAALSVKRPIAVRRTAMFRHLFDANPSICVEDSSLKQILANGIAPLEPFYNKWTKENYLKEFEDAFRIIFDDQQSTR